MELADGFVFSQTSLQDYVDCPRRFLLRYVQRCRWPGTPTKDSTELELSLQRGHRFHRLMMRLHSGISVDALEATVAGDPVLGHWWRNYLDAPPAIAGTLVMAEASLSVALGSSRLQATYDLLSGRPGGAWTIVDWKTNKSKSVRDRLARRLQTRVYPFVLTVGGHELNGGSAVIADQVSMVYWFSESPRQPEVFAYEASRRDEDARYLDELVTTITDLPEEGFIKTVDHGLCRFCTYRTLCWDDVAAGPLESLGVDQEFEEPEDLDWSAIAPIAY